MPNANETSFDRPSVSLDQTERRAPVFARWAVVALAALATVSGVLLPIDWRLEEAIFRATSLAPVEKVTVVAIDRISLEQMGENAFDPAKRAQAIKNLVDAGAKRIFVDFGMAQLGSEETAQAVVDILGTDLKGRVAFPIFSVTRKSVEGVSRLEGEPDPVLQGLADIAAVGVPVDSDGVVRRFFTSQSRNGQDISSAPVWLSGTAQVPSTELRVNFALELDGIPSLSLVDVVSGSFERSAVDGKLVVIGATDLILGDQLSVPKYSVIAGCEFLALAAMTLADGVGLNEVDPALSLALTVVLTFAAAYSLAGRRPKRIAIITGFLILGLIAIAVSAQLGFSLLLQPTAPIFGILIAATSAALQSSSFMEARQKRADGIIDDQANLIGHFLATSRDGIVTIAPDNRIMTSNAAMHSLWGSDLRGRQIGDVLPEFAAAETIEALSSGRLIETVLRPSIDVELPVEVAFNRTQQDGHLVTIAMMRDLRERKAHERQLTELATHDALTGLANRYRFEQVLKELATEETEAARPFAALLIDLDQFKEVNDTLGHSIGDMLLNAVAGRLLGFQERVACIARLGGDEFAIVTEGRKETAQIEQMAVEIFDAIVENYNVLDMTLELGASIGVAHYPEDAADPEKLLQCADVAMYQAKRDGGGVRGYNAEADENSVRRLTLKGQLRHAIESDELVLYYQPKVCPHRGVIVGSEALVRWIHPELGFMPPDEFIPAAEQSGIIHPLTIWCVRRALKDKSAFPAHLRDLPISINVSARILANDGLVDECLSELASSGMSTSDLTLEITESALMTQVEQSLAVLRRLSERGFKLSLDDFGAGYSSFDYLRRLPVDELKIDRAFLVARSRDRRADEILKGMIDLGHGLELSVVCEGVETIEEFEWLRANRCHVVQGYFTGRPMTASQFAKLPLRCQHIADRRIAAITDPT